jgi:hypothetical protein
MLPFSDIKYQSSELLKSKLIGQAADQNQAKLFFSISYGSFKTGADSHHCSMASSDEQLLLFRQSGHTHSPETY